MQVVVLGLPTKTLSNRRQKFGSGILTRVESY